MSSEVSRRGLLRGACAGCAALLVSSCSGRSSDAAAPEPGTSGGAPQPLAQLDAIPIRGSISAKSPDGKPLVLARPDVTTVVAFSAVCTHQGCTVEPDGAVLGCPCHDSAFDAFTGKVLSPPAPRPLPPYPVKVVGSAVFAD
jgi:Rieske Fe-S protein